MSRRLVFAGAVAWLSVSGCGFLNQSGPKTPAARPAEATLTEPSPGPSDPATQPAGAVNPGALASQTTAFAQSMQAQLDRRSSRSAAAPAPATAPATAPAATVAVGQFDPLIDTSEIRWLQPQRHELMLMPKQDPTPPRPAPQEMASTAPAVEAPAAAPAPPTPTERANAFVRDAQANPDQFEGQLAQRLKANPRDLDAAVEYQLLQFLRGRPVPQADAIATLSSEDQELVRALMDALINFRANARGGDNMLLSHKARPLIELADRIRTQSGLRIPTIALCDRITSFGRYEPLTPDRLVAGREVAVYCEVENFLSQLNERGLWETRLSQELVLRDDRGNQVAIEKREPVSDLSRNRRHDFYIARKLRLPAALPPGSYTLTVGIIDQQANRIAESNTSLRIIGTSALPRAVIPDNVFLDK